MMRINNSLAGYYFALSVTPLVVNGSANAAQNNTEMLLVENVVVYGYRTDLLGTSIAAAEAPKLPHGRYRAPVKFWNLYPAWWLPNTVVQAKPINIFYAVLIWITAPTLPLQLMPCQLICAAMDMGKAIRI
jgi:hypothetical protein